MSQHPNDIFNGKYFGKSVLVTGHTGFKGSWLISWLKLLGANVTGISLDPPTEPSHFASAELAQGIADLRIDIRNSFEIEKAFIKAKPDFVFHLAAQSLVRRSYDDPIETWETNVLGTINVLQALRKLESECAAVIVTSDKCYENREWLWGYKESDQLGGVDPYSASKGAAEIAISSHVKSYFQKENSKVRIATARAGNVMGGGDWAADRIIPDCVRSWSKGEIVKLRNPSATRPWQHVLEPLSGYLTLAIELNEKSDLNGESFNFGPQALQDESVLSVVEEMAKHWRDVQWVDTSADLDIRQESGLLKLNCEKAISLLGWHAAMTFKETVQMTADWYQNYYVNPKQSSRKTTEQIETYVRFAVSQGLPWAL